MDEVRLRQFMALSDPVRLALLEALRLAETPQTSAALARAVPDAAGGLGFQLDTLKQAGLIERCGGRGRAARWSASETRLEWSEEDEVDPQGLIAIRSFERELTERREVRFRRWLSEKRTDAWPPEWSGINDSLEWVLELDPTSLNQLHQELSAVIDRYRTTGSSEGQKSAAEGASGAERIFVALTTCPVKGPL